MSQLAPTPKYPAVKFETIGATVSGTVAYPPEDRQAREFGTNKPRFYDDGNPVMQTKIVLDTAEGRRALYAQGRMVYAIRDALFTSGAPDVEVGGRLTVTYTEDGEQKGGGKPPKVYTAAYEAPEGDGFDPADLPPF